MSTKGVEKKKVCRTVYVTLTQRRYAVQPDTCLKFYCIFLNSIILHFRNICEVLILNLKRINYMANQIRITELQHFQIPALTVTL